MSIDPPRVAQPRRPTILVVDDQRDVRTLLTRILEAAGYQILSAVDGMDALRLCHTVGEPIDLLMTEIQLPGLSGIELAEHFRKLHPLASVLYVSASADQEVGHTPLAPDSHALVHKPFERSYLLQQVQQAMSLASLPAAPVV